MFNFHSFKRSKNLVLSENREAELRRQLTKQGRIGQNNQENNVARSTRGYAGFGIEAPKEILDAIYNGKPFTVPVIPKFKTDIPLEVGILGKTKGSVSQDNLTLPIDSLLNANSRNLGDS